MFRRRATVLLAAVLVTGSAATLLAHMKPTKMEPAADATVTTPPTRIQVWFTEEPDPSVSKLELTGPAGAVKLKPIETTQDSIMAAVDGSLADGRYTARWQSAGDDGHVQKDEYTFTVKRAH